MAPYDRSSEEPDEDRLLTVLVTGFGPFQERFPVNPSFEIAQSLPALLPNVGTEEAIQIIPYGSPIRVCYEDARLLVPALLKSYEGTVDMVLHIGMASGRSYYAAERFAHREGYGALKDLDGKTVPTDEAEECFAECPSLMTTSLGYAALMKRWRLEVANLPNDSPAHGADCRASEDAGHYLCDYTYYNSLAWFGRQNQSLEAGCSADRPVMFLHVPPQSDEKKLAKGRDVAVSLIRAMAAGYTRRGRKEEQADA